MTHLPIVIEKIGLSFGEKSCFADFSSRIHFQKRIAITGANGAGKSLLLKIIQGLASPSTGEVLVPEGIRFGYVAQTILEFGEQSGAQRFQRALSRALALDPDVLCLDEPTNHLDVKNRHSLQAMLAAYRGTLLVISHDINLLRKSFDMLWHIENKQVHEFAGTYDDFMHMRHKAHQALEVQKDLLRREAMQVHNNLMRDQVRSKKKKLHGEKKYDGDKLALRSAQGRGQMTTNKNRRRFGQEKHSIMQELSRCKIPEIIRPNFVINNASYAQDKAVVSIVDGSCGYQGPLLSTINLQILAHDRLALCGPNGCGKSTLVKAIMGDRGITRTGIWKTPPLSCLGYLDQHYKTLDLDLSPYEIIQNASPAWTRELCRSHLNNFLFRKNEEVTTKVRWLSGGEKARLSLAQIAANTPQLLILDEVTNNLDLTTRQHVIEVLKSYPAALLVISHDEDFLDAIGASVHEMNSFSLA